MCLRICAALFMVVVLALSGCHSRASTKTLFLHGQAMGTSWQVTIPRYPHSSDASSLQQEIATTLEQLEAQLSHWREDSLVSQFNRSDSTLPMEITPELATVIEEAQRTYELSAGAFDITAAPLVNLWGFGPPGRQKQPPTAQQINEVLQYVNSADLQIVKRDPSTSLLRKRIANLQIDLSALAKGYAIDLIAEQLSARQFDSFLIELGGELRARGTNTTGKVWQIGLEQPDTQSIGRVRRTIALRDLAIATSGGYRNFVGNSKNDGIAYHHIIDPRTGRPVAHNLVSVTVVASTAMRADAWATALMVLGPDKGYELASERKLAATFVIDSGSDVTEKSTEFFHHRLSESSLPEKR